jgi:hypothetical protein
VDRDGQETSPAYLYREPFFTNLSGVEQGTSDECVRLRTRAPNGEESEPVELCGADADRHVYAGSNDDVACTANGVTFAGAAAAAPSGAESSEHGGRGCAVTPRPSAHGVAWPALFALLGMVARLRSRTSPRAPRSRRG